MCYVILIHLRKKENSSTFLYLNYYFINLHVIHIIIELLVIELHELYV